MPVSKAISINGTSGTLSLRAARSVKAGTLSQRRLLAVRSTLASRLTTISEGQELTDFSFDPDRTLLAQRIQRSLKVASIGRKVIESGAIASLRKRRLESLALRPEPLPSTSTAFLSGLEPLPINGSSGQLSFRAARSVRAGMFSYRRAIGVTSRRGLSLSEGVETRHLTNLTSVVERRLRDRLAALPSRLESTAERRFTMRRAVSMAPSTPRIFEPGSSTPAKEIPTAASASFFQRLRSGIRNMNMSSILPLTLFFASNFLLLAGGVLLGFGLPLAIPIAVGIGWALFGTGLASQAIFLGASLIRCLRPRRPDQDAENGAVDRYCAAERDRQARLREADQREQVPPYNECTDYLSTRPPTYSVLPSEPPQYGDIPPPSYDNHELYDMGEEDVIEAAPNWRENYRNALPPVFEGISVDHRAHEEEREREQERHRVRRRNWRGRLRFQR